jgi:peptidoglycan biosynthesis protein MviN/MurJ (putative lipid II flippase)
MRYWLHAGIALSTSITALVTAMLLVALLARKITAIRLLDLMTFLLRCLVLSVPAVAIVFGISYLFNVRDDTLVARSLGVALAVLGCGIYFAFALATKTEESRLVVQYATSMLGRRRA